jgi:peptidoglycan hydrolase-like protein with peptidoglycan-binding domain
MRPARRRSSAYGYVTSSRPDRVAAWALVLGVFLILLAATTSRGDTGGNALPVAPGAPDSAAFQLGERLLATGSAGDDVRTLQSILRSAGYGPVLVSGFFDTTTADAVERFQRDAGLSVDGVVGPQTRPALLRLMKVRVATWYGPGLYGRRTACGVRLRTTTVGVAHKRLPCGTAVTFYRGGRFVTLNVIDRGPFGGRAAWDLTAAAARRLGLTATGRLRSTR